MRNAILAGLLAATLVPGLAQAQSPGELRGDQRDVNQQRRELQQDYRDHAPGAEIRADRHDLAVANVERRQDWRDYRRAHPEIYRGRAWAGPRGYAYRPVDVGYRFRPEFYDRRYWIDAPRYRLHAVDGPRRWVRYGNDVLLVDTRTGRVLEVNNGFFRKPSHLQEARSGRATVRTFATSRRTRRGDRPTDRLDCSAPLEMTSAPTKKPGPHGSGPGPSSRSLPWISLPKRDSPPHICRADRLPARTRAGRPR